MLQENIINGRLWAVIDFKWSDWLLTYHSSMLLLHPETDSDTV